MTPAEFARRLRSVTPERVTDALRVGLTGAALKGQREAVKACKSRLKVRTGRLSQSIAGKIEPGSTSDAIKLTLSAGGRVAGGADVKYAATHEFGATITPKNSKMLRIPIPGGPALTRAGVDRFATPLRATGAGQFAIQKSGGKLYLINTAAKGKAAARPWYVLRYSVKIPARPFMGPAFEAVKATIPDVVAKSIRRVLAV
jgi:phage gpG-like protein